MSDPVNPSHYKTASGIQCADIAELLGFNLGNAFKYAWRAGTKPGASLVEDLSKARWYVRRAYQEPANAVARASCALTMNALSTSIAEPWRLGLLEHLIEASFEVDRRPVLVLHLNNLIEHGENRDVFVSERKEGES